MHDSCLMTRCLLIKSLKFGWPDLKLGRIWPPSRSLPMLVRTIACRFWAQSRAVASPWDLTSAGRRPGTEGRRWEPPWFPGRTWPLEKEAPSVVAHCHLFFIFIFFCCRWFCLCRQKCFPLHRYCFPFGRPDGALKATLSLQERVRTHTHTHTNELNEEENSIIIQQQSRCFSIIFFWPHANTSILIGSPLKPYPSPKPTHPSELLITHPLH